jgi:hypothetical protein
MFFKKIIFLAAIIFSIIPLISCGGGGTSSGGKGASTPQQKIVFAGDSSIRRADLNSLFGMPITNYGVDGRESRELLNAIEGYVSSKPNKIFIGIGGNNILNRHEGWLLGDISAMIDKIKAVSPGTVIFFLSILPKQDAQVTALVQIYNGQIQSLCDGKGVKFISTFSLFYDLATVIRTEYYDSDGIHLNSSGYQLWAGPIRPYVLS